MDVRSGIAPCAFFGFIEVNSLLQTLHAIAAALDRHQVRYALIGGIAVSVRTEPRFTRDIDVAIAVTNDTQAEAVMDESEVQQAREALALIAERDCNRGRNLTSLMDLILAT